MARVSSRVLSIALVLMSDLLAHQCSISLVVLELIDVGINTTMHHCGLQQCHRYCSSQMLLVISCLLLTRLSNIPTICCCCCVAQGNVVAAAGSSDGQQAGVDAAIVQLAAQVLHAIVVQHRSLVRAALRNMPPLPSLAVLKEVNAVLIQVCDRRDSVVGGSCMYPAKHADASSSC